MLRTTLLAATLVALACSSSWAQNPRVEIGATAGWTFSDGVSGDAVVVPGVGAFSRVEPKDAFSWGVRAALVFASNIEVGALFDQQATRLQLGGAGTLDVGKLTLRDYHGYVAYDLGDSDARIRPYLLAGLGATHYGPITASLGGNHQHIAGNTRFSPTLAAGVKLFLTRRVAIRGEGRWTPTSIRQELPGWWCNSDWGCYVASSSQYANQIELAGGLVFRF
jgi:opacity protein-like surface antigen